MELGAKRPRLYLVLEGECELRVEGRSPFQGFAWFWWDWFPGVPLVTRWLLSWAPFGLVGNGGFA